MIGRLIFTGLVHMYSLFKQTTQLLKIHEKQKKSQGHGARCFAAVE